MAYAAWGVSDSVSKAYRASGLPDPRSFSHIPPSRNKRDTFANALR